MFYWSMFTSSENVNADHANFHTAGRDLIINQYQNHYHNHANAQVVMMIIVVLGFLYYSNLRASSCPTIALT